MFKLVLEKAEEPDIKLATSAAPAAAAKSLQLCPTLCDPVDGSPLGSFVPGITSLGLSITVSLYLLPGIYTFAH